MAPIYFTYQKVERVLKSCTNLIQFNVAEKYFNQFRLLYKSNTNFKLYSQLLYTTWHLKYNEFNK